MVIEMGNLFVAIVSLKDSTRSRSDTRVQHGGEEGSWLTSRTVKTELDKIQWGTLI